MPLLPLQLYICISICTQALDGSSPLYLAYYNHLSSASAYYSELLQKLEAQYGVTVTGLDGTQLEGDHEKLVTSRVM